MKKSMIFSVMRSIVCCMMILAPLGINLSKSDIINNDKDNKVAYTAYDKTEEDTTPLPQSGNVVLLNLENEYCDTKCYLEKNDDTITFMSKTFGIDKSVIYEDLIKINKDNLYDGNNIGRLTDKNGNLKSYSSFELGLIEYLYKFSKENPKLVDNTVVPYTGSSEYIEKLIKYYTGIYTDVDYLTAVSIGAAESGYYKVKYMLRCNNVFGGMSSSGLTKYKNIEYGVLSYIRILSTGYYSQGLTTLESIGRKYCPTTNASGNKIASPHWINLVNSAKKHYANTNEDITVEYLLNI